MAYKAHLVLIACLVLMLCLIACTGAEDIPVLPQASPVATETGVVEATAALTPAADAATPTSTVPAGWLSITDANWGYSFSYPPRWEECTTTPNSHVFCEVNAAPGGPRPPAFYVTVIPAGFTNLQAEAYNFMPETVVQQITSLAVGESIVTESGNADFFTYTRLSDVSVGSEMGIVIENERVWEAPAGVRERRVLVQRGDVTYLIGSYYETQDDLAAFGAALGTVTFAGP